MKADPAVDRAALKADVRLAIERSAPWIIGLAKRAYSSPEVGFHEVKTADLVEDALQSLGIRVRSGLAVTGVRGDVNFSGKGPRIGVMGELDALRSPRHPGADADTGAAHACGHHAQLGMLLGVAIGLNAPGVARALSGGVALIATPAEEFVDVGDRLAMRRDRKLQLMSGKQEMIRLGVFDDVDMAMLTHTTSSRPAGGRFVVGGSTNAHTVHYVRFLGKAAHAGGSPHEGVNALQAATLALTAVNTQRETFEPLDQTRVHGIITRGGDVTNAVPDEVVYEGRVRARDMETVDKIASAVERCYRAGALAIGGGLEVVSLPGYMPLRTDPGLNQVFASNVREAFGDDAVLEQPPDANGGGSTDMGDLSQLMPAIHPYVAAASGAGHGSDYRISDYRRAVVDPAVSMANTIVDLLADDARVARSVLHEHVPAMDKAAYLRSQLGRLRESRYSAG
ncbi:MAG: amidohydrolase [Chloroflexota bacterium]